MITPAIVLAGLLVLVGSVYAVELQPGGPGTAGRQRTLYLAGIVAILPGWINGDLQC